MISPQLFHYLAAGFAVVCGAIGTGIGLGNAGLGVQDALIRQDLSVSDVFRSTIIGLALIESGAIIALVTTLILLFGTGGGSVSFDYARAEMGIGLAVGVAAAAISLASSFVVKAATQAIARQPFFAAKIITFMLISQSIIEAPVIFSFIVSLVIKTQLTATVTQAASYSFFAAGLTVAIGCVGPSIGQALFGYNACKAIGININSYGRLFPFSLLMEAIIETPMIFCVLFSLLMLYSTPIAQLTLIGSTKHIIAAATIGTAAVASSLAIGHVTSKTCHFIAMDPEIYAALARTTLLAVAFIESSMIYALIIALLMTIK